MTNGGRATDRRLETDNSSYMPRSSNSEVPLVENPLNRPNCIRTGVEPTLFLSNDDTRFQDHSLLLEPITSLKGDIFEQSEPSTLARTPAGDEKEQHPCLKPGCDKIFTHLHKLQRHYRDAHGKPQYDCPYPNCTRKGPKGFARKDNMRQHHKLVHNKHLDPREVPRWKRGASSYVVTMP